MRTRLQGNGRVALGMSGGVDSSVAAALLLDAGYEVVGVTLRFHGTPADLKAEQDAAGVCEKLGIPHKVHDAEGCFEACVVEPFAQAYARGLTPSPCVSCNATCKMPSLIEAADELGCGCVATGHYVRVVELPETGRFAVKTALFPQKDQSYMLAMLCQGQLARLLAPLGAMTKTDVRLMAADLGLAVAERPESQDNCFVEGDYRDFLRDRGVVGNAGPVVNREGKVVGTHQGLLRYTLGQRKGLGIAAPKPYYVIGKRPERNELVVGFKDESLIQGVVTAPPNWQAIDALDGQMNAMVKLRYRSSPAPCIMVPDESGRVEVRLLSPQPTTAPGQYAVFYQGDVVLGGAMIEEVISA